jgi:hypothetical protein
MPVMPGKDGIRVSGQGFHKKYNNGIKEFIMKKWVNIGVIAVTLMMIGSGFAMAADQKRDQDRLKDQKKDGSCKIIQDAINGDFLAATQARKGSRKQSRLKDGFCQS